MQRTDDTAALFESESELEYRGMSMCISPSLSLCDSAYFALLCCALLYSNDIIARQIRLLHLNPTQISLSCHSVFQEYPSASARRTQIMPRAKEPAYKAIIRSSTLTNVLCRVVLPSFPRSRLSSRKTKGHRKMKSSELHRCTFSPLLVCLSFLIVCVIEDFHVIDSFSVAFCECQ